MRDIGTQHGEQIRVYGTVQGVGFRPCVWRFAKELGITGTVCNDGDGVLIHAWGTHKVLQAFINRLKNEPPPLARIDGLHCANLSEQSGPKDFQILTSQDGEARTNIVADAATCSACLDEILDPNNRRYFYPFTNCTHCGPRLSIIETIPYDRVATSMSRFDMCARCHIEYSDPNDRRFHAQANACSDCGPRIWLTDKNTKIINDADPYTVIKQTCDIIRKGKNVAIKGIGGIHLACDATNEIAVTNLRTRKHRYQKPFALMAKDLAMIKDYCQVSEQEAMQLMSKEAPIVILEAHININLSKQIAPGQNHLGFMLPYSPLHHLLMQLLAFPIVLTSANHTNEPQCIDMIDAQERLKNIADYYLCHDREIINRLDDSVVRIIANHKQTLRRARGYAPLPIPLPQGFETAPNLIAMGGEFKGSFCIVKDGQAVVSQHMGDLENAKTFHDYRYNIKLYKELFAFYPQTIVVDKHPDYLSTQEGAHWSNIEHLNLEVVQHHHAHVAACMAEKGLPLSLSSMLGIVMDGLGYGDDGTLWGGEFLQVNYLDCVRLAHFDAIAMIGGNQAIYEPWRNTYAHLQNSYDWQDYLKQYSGLAITKYLQEKPLSIIKAMLQRKINSPLASSCGRLFDAVAAALGICPDKVDYEGQAAIELQAMAERIDEDQADEGYDIFNIKAGDELILEWRILWQLLLHDLKAGIAKPIIAYRFHMGLARTIVDMAVLLCVRESISTVILSGGVFQNKLLLEHVIRLFSKTQLNILVPEVLPVNDGGISFGQAVIAAARAIQAQ